MAFHAPMDNNPSFSSASSFEYGAAPVPMGAPMPPGSMMMMPGGQQVQSMGVMQSPPMQAIGVMQQPVQSMGMMQQQPLSSMTVMPQQHVQPMGIMQQQPVQSMGHMSQQPVQQQVMYRPVQVQSSMPQLAPQSVPPLPSNYVPQPFMYPAHQGMSYGYRPMMQQARMIPSGMPIMNSSNGLGTPQGSFPSQPPMLNPLSQQLVY